MSFLNSIKQAANNFVTKVEDLFSLHDYEEKRKNSEILLSSDKYIWGNCPFKNCSVSLLNDEIKSVTNAECPSCYRLFCAQCKIPWHGGHNCQRFQQRENRILKKRKSFFKDRDDEKKRKKKVALVVDQPNQNSIKQAANKIVAKVEDLFSLHDDKEKKKNSKILFLGNKDIQVNCPFKNCSVSLLNDEIKIVTNAECPSCHKLFCAHCKVPWHGGHNCQRFQQRENTSSEKRKSPFEDRDDEKKKKKKFTFAINQPNQNSVNVKCNEFTQQNLKGILKCSVTSNEKELKKENTETSYECSSLSPNSFCGLCSDFIQDSDIVRGSAICNHPFCANCISKHVADQLSHDIKNVYCPNPGCCVELKPQHLQHILPKEVIGRWEYESYIAWWNCSFK